MWRTVLSETFAHALHDRNISQADILKLNPPLNLEIYYASGSLVSGSGNPGSDLDIYVITDASSLEERVPDGQPIRNGLPAREVRYFLNGTKVDFVFYRSSDVNRFINGINNLKFTPDNHNSHPSILIPPYFDESIALFLIRLWNSVAIYGGNHFDQYLSRFNFSKYKRWRARSLLSLAQSIYIDAVGMQRKGDAPGAVARCHSLTVQGTWSYLYSRGICVDREKWVPSAVSKLGESDRVGEIFRTIVFGPHSGDASEMVCNQLPLAEEFLKLVSDSEMLAPLID